jgi:hypothetical protein
VGIRVGPLTLGCETPEEGFAAPLVERYAPFRWDGPCDWTVSLRRAPDIDMTRFPDIRVWSDSARGIHWVFRWDFVARLEPARRRGEMLLTSLAGFGCADTALRMAASFAALEAGGALMHGAAVVSRRGGFLFSGVSGQGKSTVGKLSGASGRDVLTDEIALLVRDSGGWTLGGTPFWGELGLSVNRAAPLRGILLLHQGPAHAVKPVGAGEAVPALLQTVMCFGHDADTLARTMDLGLELVSGVPVRRLEFLPDAGFWDEVDRAWA